MMPSLQAAFPVCALPAISHCPQPPAYTGARDEAIRVAFAAFDTPSHCGGLYALQQNASAGVPRLPQQAGLPNDDARDQGVQVYAINEYLKCIFGVPHDATVIGPRVAQHIIGLDSVETSAPHALSVSRLTALAAFYIGLCQARAFTADGDFDTPGLIDFVAARLCVARDIVENVLSGSTFATYVFMSMKQSRCAGELSIYDAHGQDLRVPSASLRCDELAYGATCSAYLRNVTLRFQTIRGVDFSAADLSGAYIGNCIFESVSFNNAHLSDAVFSKTVATQCTFAGANLARAALRDSRLNNTLFQKCDMTAIGFHATALQSTRFDACDLRGMAFDNDSELEGATRLGIDQTEFQACDMTGARLRHFQWTDGGLTDCRLWDATVSDSGFTRAIWRHQLGILVRPPLSGATFDAIQFRACVLTQIDASESKWTQCLFEKGKLSGASWRRSVLGTVRFVSVGMAGVHFDNSVCDGLRIEAMCDLDRVSFADARLTNVRFDAALTKTMLRLNSIDFSSAELDGVSFVKCQMVAAKFPATQLRGVQFSRCNLNHSDFRGSLGGDLLRMLMSNRMKRYSAEGMIAVGAAIGSLNSRTRRDTLLNHVASRDCMLANVMSGSSGVMTANLVLHIADRLQSEADDPIDADVWMIAALTQAYKKVRSAPDIRAQIDVHLFRMLQRHLPELNDLGLWSRPEHRWGLDAVEHLCRLLHAQREAPGVLWRNSPLIASMSIGAYIGALTLDRPTRALLEVTRRAVVPVDLLRAFGEWTSASAGASAVACAVASAGDGALSLPHAALLTPDGERAVILLPATSAALLGVRSDPVVADYAYVAFRVVDGRWQPGSNTDVETRAEACSEAGADAVFAPFPLVGPVLHPRAESFARLIDSLALPADIREIFTNGLIHYRRRNLCTTRDQHRIDQAFRPLMTSMRDAPGGGEQASWLVAHLQPLEIHQSRVYSALSHLYLPGDAPANGTLALGLATLFFRAASTEMFGIEDNTPQLLAYYAFSWLNQAISLYPALLPELGGADVHLEIARQTVGARDAVSHMAVIGARLMEMFSKPLLVNHAHARRVRAELCR